MTISIVIPVYNEEIYINACLVALGKQEEKPDEIIIVDNNSTDKTIEIAKKFPVTIIRERKQGITFARNAGFNHAQGDIIARCDADVIVPNDWVKKIKSVFSAKKDIVALTGLACFYDLFFIKKSTLPFLFYHRIMRILLGHNVIVGPNMAIKKEVWNKVKNHVCLNDKLVHEDIDLSIHVHQYGKIEFVPSLIVRASGRRIKYNPLSFFGEYQWRLIKTLRAHHS